MPETTISQRSPLADYFDDQNISVQQHNYRTTIGRPSSGVRVRVGTISLNE